jgi:dolichol kinase
MHYQGKTAPSFQFYKLFEDSHTSLPTCFDNQYSVLTPAFSSRSGSKTEALGGPLIYTTVLFLCTLLFFRDSPIGVVAMTQMAAGDGIADIIGRQVSSQL